MSRTVPTRAASIGLATAIACGISIVPAEASATKIEIAKNDIGAPPTDFEFRRTGEGDLGQWTVVADLTAVEGVAIEHVSTDQQDDRFPLAIYKPLSAENVELSIRLKIISGSSQTAGVALCLRSPDSYYAVSANAFEQRVDLILFAGGKSKRIEGAEADVVRNRWHTLGVMLNDDHFTVSLDGKVLFTTYDRTRMKDGYIALWTQEDNVTRFDQIEIRPLPNTEWR